ncbi:MAG: PAS domain-containing protein, partial [Acidobacteriota bacterium]
MIPTLFSSLRFRLAILIVLAMAMMLGLTVSTYYSERELVRSHIEDDVRRVAMFTASTHERIIEETRQLLVSLARLPEVRNCRAEACSTHFAHILEENLTFANLGAILPDGRTYCNASPAFFVDNYGDQPWFHHAVEFKDFSMGSCQTRKDGDHITLNLGYPILDDEDAVKAVVFATLNLDQINQPVLQAQLPGEAEFFMVTDRGTILAHLPHPEQWVGRSLLDAPIMQAVLTTGDKVTEIVGLDGVARLYAFTPLSSIVETGLYICIGIPKTTVYSEADAILVRHFVGLGFVTLLALFAVWFGGEVLVVRHVNALASVAQRLSGGDMRARTGLSHGAGELGRLARSFDDMAEALERRATQLHLAETKYRTLVEQVPVITYAASLDERRTTIYISPQVEAILGISPGSWMDDPGLWLGHIHPDDLARVREKLMRSRMVREPFRCEYRFTARDGRTVWFMDEAVVVPNEGDRSHHLQGIMRDVTESRKAEEALRESEERFRLLVEC